MKKGQVWEGIVKEVDFPNKGKVFLPEEDRYRDREKYSAGTEDQIFSK